MRQYVVLDRFLSDGEWLVGDEEGHLGSFSDQQYALYRLAPGVGRTGNKTRVIRAPRSRGMEVHVPILPLPSPFCGECGATSTCGAPIEIVAINQYRVGSRVVEAGFGHKTNTWVLLT